MMTPMPAWTLALAIGVGAILLAAAAADPDLHMLATGAVAAAFVLFAIYRHRTLATASASQSAIGAATARGAGLVWTWGALGIVITYFLFSNQAWPEWWHFFLGFTVAAIASLGFAAMLDRDTAAGRIDESMLKVGRTLIIVQLVGVILALVSMFFDGKFPRAATYPDWFACNIFFFGGLAIAAISVDALRRARSV